MIAQQTSTSAALPRQLVKVLVLLALAAALIAVIMWWRSIALTGQPPQLFQVFDSLVVVASLVVLAFGFRLLELHDWTIALTAGTGWGLLVPSTGFYSMFEWALGPSFSNPASIAFAHGVGVTITLLAGLVIMRRGGPVSLRTAKGAWKAALMGLGFGVLVGIPLALINAYANTLVQNRPFVLQTSVFPLVEALEPAIVEEVVYRFALLGIVWMLLQPFWGSKAVRLAAAFTLLVHSYAHYGNLLVDQPLMYLAFGPCWRSSGGYRLPSLPCGAISSRLSASTGFKTQYVSSATCSGKWRVSTPRSCGRHAGTSPWIFL